MRGLRLVTYFFSIGFALIISSCGKTVYLYDQVGFEPGERPNENVNSNSGGPVPGYYYRSAPTYGNSYPPQYQPAQPYSQRAPGSRFYSNPYDIPPSPYYPNNYDVDQYYTPPSYYGSDLQENRNRDPR